MTSEQLIKAADLERIATDGAQIYLNIKFNYEPEDNGNYLAIETETQKVYLGETSAEAVVKAKTEHPDKVFYVLKIGSDAAETIARLFPGK